MDEEEKDQLRNAIRGYFRQTPQLLSIIEPNSDLSKGHIQKAEHDLEVATDLEELGHSDWTIVAAYYTMYQSCQAILARIGLKSDQHQPPTSL
ncbi:MAG: HEPN domain-containing protein [Candidatus Nanohaloarchaea archaeon]|nr:HEPN domain-containing protein [Candidatus Nanohaloarchaea archaeon]